MTASRAKGAKAEKAAARWLTAEGWPTKRRLAGNGQAGDLMIADAPHVVVDVKDRPAPAVTTWLGQLDAEADGRPHQLLLWKPWSKGPNPGDWLAIVANEPMGYYSNNVRRPVTFDVAALDTPALRSVLGWLDVEYRARLGDWADPALYWQDWLLMRASTWAAEVLPCWEGQA